MRLRILFTLGFVLLLSTFASSNECLRQHHAVECKGTTSPAPSINGEYSTLLVNKLLLI
ncbi:MAG TPA: hypothetical protein VKQ52_15805 [Puia sp.]|nr:hypothetical protein [Puia sp.]